MTEGAGGRKNEMTFVVLQKTTEVYKLEAIIVVGTRLVLVYIFKKNKKAVLALIVLQKTNRSTMYSTHLYLWPL